MAANLSFNLLNSKCIRSVSTLLLLFSFSAYSQDTSSIPGTYIQKDKRGLHVVPGQSFGDMHTSSYISSIDTVITRTLILDSLNNASLKIDTTYGNSLGIITPTSTMKGIWYQRTDTLFVQYDRIETHYSNLSFSFVDTNNVLKNNQTTSLPLKEIILEQFEILMYYNNRYLGTNDDAIVNFEIHGVLPFGEQRMWMKYNRQ